MSNLFVGIDPGLSGAIAYFDLESGRVQVEDMPTVTGIKGGKTKNQINVAALVTLLSTGAFGEPIRHAFIERVSASPQMGVTSAFTFGLGYGLIQGILAANLVPYTLVTPAQWKARLKCPADKGGARQRASQLFPKEAHQWRLAKHDGRAEAAMLAYYGAVWLAGAGK